jgi:hypothetical protein
VTLPAAIWLCPIHHDEFTVPHGGVCPAPGCHEELAEYAGPLMSEPARFVVHIDGLETAHVLADRHGRVIENAPTVWGEQQRADEGEETLDEAVGLLREVSHLLHNLPAIPERDERALRDRIDAWLEENK